jgi:formylglycine-generating enzyme required for sulfatase activity
MRKRAARTARRTSKRRSVLIFLSMAAVLFGTVAAATSSVEKSAGLGDGARCRTYGGVPEGFPRRPTAGMVWIEGGEFTPGSERGYPEERGGARAQVAGFWIDRTEVTNAQFARFVGATGYVTEAERAGAAPVFRQPSEQEYREGAAYSWWRDVPGASWRHPEGPRSNLSGRASHPVVQVTHADALAYARWLRRALPSELQWEYAAKAGRDDLALHREPRDARKKPSANFWQGQFPLQNSREDGHERSAPVGCFAQNPFGLFDMLGNVWEWTGSIYTASHRTQDRDEPAHDAQHGAGFASELGCSQPARLGARMTLKGGSFLCAASFCARYRVAARHAQEADQPALHVGFRTVVGAR